MTIFLLFCMLLRNYAQLAIPVTTGTEQKLESNTENNKDLETEDDTYLQQMQEFLKDPMNLNDADENDLKELLILTPLQIRDLVSYRNLFGKFINIYELQAVPGWTISTIQKIRPFITVSIQNKLYETFNDRIRKGVHSLLVRGTQVPERSKGYLPGPSTVTNFYRGSPQKILMRYKYNFKNLLQYGILAEKDAGEQFFKGKQKQGFDFYSAHFFIKDMGKIRALVLGDFTVNLGQGLTQWQSLAFKKSGDVTSIKREATVLRPYNSAGEINFHRGIGITLAKAPWQATAFVSYKNIDANLVPDTTQNGEDFVSSLQSSGYHRTNSEENDKGIQRQLAFGGNFSYTYKWLHIGFNGIQYRFKQPLVKPADPYNKYALSGKSFGNYSLDYSYTYKNFHVFGEAAVTDKFDKAVINGLMISVSAAVDLSVLYRNISRSYRSLYANAFTENTYPENEKGLYVGIEVRPNDLWHIDAYADIYQFPWLKYRVDKPSTGSDLLIQATYKPNKQLEIYSRFHSGSKAINVDPGTLHLSSVEMQPRRNWRSQVSYRISPSVTLRNRVEMSWFNKGGIGGEEGFLTWFDALFKPALRHWSGNARLQYFETGGYDSRLYTYEDDVLYNFSIPAFYDKGFRYYINFNDDINKKLTIWVRWAQTIYTGKNLIGSGLDEIAGNAKSEIKLQANYKF